MTRVPDKRAMRVRTAAEAVLCLLVAFDLLSATRAPFAMRAGP